MIEHQRIFWSGQYLAPDSSDPGIDPDSGHLEGEVTFTPVWDASVYGLLSDSMRSTYVKPFPFEIVDGQLMSDDDGEMVPGVKVPASIGGHPVNWVARFNLSAGGDSITVRELRFTSNPGGEVHLHNVIPSDAIYPQLPQDVIKGDSVTDIYAQGRYVIFIVGNPPQTKQYVIHFPGTEDVIDAAIAALEEVESRIDVEHEHVHQDVSHVDDVAAQTAAMLDQANVFAQDQVPPYLQQSVLDGRYGTKAELGSIATQPDYVARCVGESTYSRMTVTRKSNDFLEVRCIGDNGHSVAYNIGNPARYQIVRDIHAEYPGLTDKPYSWHDLTTTGTWGGTTTSPFTTTVGATFEAQVEVGAESAVGWRSYADSRGGVWRVEVVELPGVETTVSTWRETAQMVLIDSLLTIPEAGTYTIRGEFLGADPEHAPSSGDARGWTGSVQASGGATYTLLVGSHTGGFATEQLAPISNRDFAFRMRPAGSAGNFEFVPYHGTESEAFAEETRYYNAGRPFDPYSLAVEEPVEVDGFEWVQSIYGRNESSSDPTQNIVQVWTRQSIKPDSTFSVSGRMKYLAPVEMHWSAYPIMFMGLLPLFDELISSRRTSHHLDGSIAPANVWLTEEGGTVDSYALLSSSTEFIAAMTMDDRADTLRIGQFGVRDEESRTFIEFRTGGGMVKVYQPVYAQGTVVQPGYVQRFAGKYWHGHAPGLRDALTLT